MSVHFSSASDDWETPQHLFDQLNDDYKFDIDVCASVKSKPKPCANCAILRGLKNSKAF